MSEADDRPSKTCPACLGMTYTEEDLIQENQQWETHWVFIRGWLAEVADGHISGNDAVKVMDSLRPRGDEQ